MVFFHQILGKGLGAFQDGGILSGAEDPQTLRLKYVHNTAHQRIIHADDGQIDLFFFGEGCQLFKLHGADIHALGQFRDPRVSGGAVYLFSQRTLAHLPGNGVLSSAASYHQNLHLFILSSEIYWLI